MIQRFLLGVLVALLATAAGCSNGPSSNVVEDSAVRMARLRDSVAIVAEAQLTADDLLSRLVTSVRSLEATVVKMRDPAAIDQGIEDWEAIAADWPEEGSPPVRAALRDVATAVDDARLVLVRVRNQRTSEWERLYLDAEDEVLAAVRAYAEAADRLSQAIEHHWDDLVVVHDLVVSFVERRWFFRSSNEATQAFEVEVDDLLDQLDTAARDVNLITREREMAAVTVNVATAGAQELWAERPLPAPTTQRTAGRSRSGQSPLRHG